MKDYYYILGLQQTATSDDIKKAYRKLSLKFHPDKNEGDEFFAERFKDIKEAYETLYYDSKRKMYDNAFTNNFQKSSKTRTQNLMPEIELFRANKSQFAYGEEVTFSWRTINSNKVTLAPLGIVQPIGEKTYKIMNFKNDSLSFELIAENTNINRQKKLSLTLKNKTYHELYEYFQSKIESDKNKNQQSEGQSFKKNESNRNFQFINYKTDKGILEIRGNRAYINGKQAPNGKYKIGLFSSVTVKDGILVKG